MPNEQVYRAIRVGTSGQGILSFTTEQPKIILLIGKYFYYNAKTGEKLTAAKLFGTTKAKLNAKVRNLYLKKYDKEGVEAGFYEGFASDKSDRDALKDNLAPMDFNNQFYVKDGKAVFYANPYDLGPYAAGYIEVSASAK